MTLTPDKDTWWSRAKDLASRTPESRNRYVDFLRAASITVVVVGHWLMAAAYFEGGALKLGDMLHRAPWMQWITWVFQVMPLFFIVGGYANAASWEAARRTGQGYGQWTSSRLRRLVGPVIPLLIVWSVMAAVAHGFGVHPQLIKVGSQVALIPTWFLAVYVMVVIAAPGTYWAWRRFGVWSFWALALSAVAVDAIAFTSSLGVLRWINYVFIWLAVHQLGYMWRGGQIAAPRQALAWAGGGFAALVFLVLVAGYPVSMITVPGEAISNSRPPTLALLALGAFHGGLALTLEPRVRGWLQGLRPWTATVLVNGTIMTLYLWHVTVMVLMVGLANLLGGIGLGLQPGTGSWWASRPLWIAFLAVVLSVFVAVFGRFEQTRRAESTAPFAALRGITGAVGVCIGLAVLALHGIGSAGMLGVRLAPVIVALAGAALILGAPARRSAAP